MGLGWVHPFGVSGHLWYITMLLIMYIAFVLVSRLRLDKISSHWWLWGIAVLLNVCISNIWLILVVWLITTLISAIMLNKATNVLCAYIK